MAHIAVLPVRYRAGLPRGALIQVLAEDFVRPLPREDGFSQRAAQKLVESAGAASSFASSRAEADRDAAVASPGS